MIYDVAHLKEYHLIATGGSWVLKRRGVKRALINFRNRSYGKDFSQVFSVTMTYAEDMLSLYIHDRNGSVLQKLNRLFICLFLEKK